MGICLYDNRASKPELYDTAYGLRMPFLGVSMVMRGRSSQPLRLWNDLSTQNQLTRLQPPTVPYRHSYLG